MRTAVFCLGLAASIALCSPALAQGRGRAGPVITELCDGNNQRVTKSVPGGSLVIKGRNFWKMPTKPQDADDDWKAPSRADFVQVTVGGQKAFVFDSTFDYVSFIIPQSVRPAKNVRIELKIKYKGSWNVAKTKVNVLDKKEWRASAKERGSESGGGREAEEIQILQSFKINKFAQERSGAGDMFVVEGIAQGVPDRATVQVELRYSGDTIPQGLRLLTIKNGEFRTTFGPYSRKVPYGNFSLELLFELGKQSKRLKRKWKRTLSDRQQELYGRVYRRGVTQVGTGPGGTLLPEDLKRQTVRTQEHYKVFATEVEKLRDELRDVVADASRCFFREGRSYKEDAYIFWLKRMGFAASDSEAKSKFVEKPKYATSGGHFKAKDYLAWARKRMIKGIVDLHEKHRKFNDQYICPLDAKADTLGEYLIAIVLLRFQDWSQGLYEKSGVEVPTEIGRIPVSPVRPQTITKKFFDAKRKELLRRVGLGDMIK